MHLYRTCTQVLEVLCVAHTKMDLSENYIICAEFNITASMLFEDATLQPLQITKKGLVLELYQIQKSAKLPWATYAKWVYSSFDQVAPCPAYALRRSMDTQVPICKKRSVFKKISQERIS
jgi:hypothetical protein